MGDRGLSPPPHRASNSPCRSKIVTRPLEADGLRSLMEAEAEGLKAILTRKAEGFDQIVLVETVLDELDDQPADHAQREQGEAVRDGPDRYVRRLQHHDARHVVRPG